MLKWLETRKAVEFGEAMALEILDTLSRSDAGPGSPSIKWPAAKSNRKKGKAPAETEQQKATKLTAKAEKTLSSVDSKVREFKEQEKLNFYQRSKLANAFLWKLQDEGCTPEYAKELTQWLTFRL